MLIITNLNLISVQSWTYLSFLQKQCMEKCGIKRPTMPGKLADEENDPRRHPSLPPNKVSSACFMTF